MRRPFSLSPRLRAVADLVPVGARLADVGTDHGRLPVWLLQRGIIDRAVASDLRPGPLGRARELAEKWGFSDRVSFRLCDGLAEIEPEEAQVVTIAGMGGETIASILTAVPWTNEPGHTYILQAMSGMDGLRRSLSERGFTILREILVPEGDTLYIVLLAEPGKVEPLTEGEIWVGRQTLGMESPLRGRYLDQELEKLRRAVEGLARTQKPEEEEKRRSYEAILREVEHMREEWRQWYE